MCSSLQRNWQTRSTWHCIPAFASTTSTNWVHTWVCGFSALSGHFTIQSQLLIYCFIFLDINFDLCVWSHLSHQRPQSTTHITDFHTSCYFSLKTAWLSVDRAHSLAWNTAADVSFKPLLYWLPWWWVTAEKNRPTRCQCLILLLLNNVTYKIEKNCFHDNNNC